MYNAGIIFQISQESKFADFVSNMLLEYAELYPTLPLHPARKMKSQNEIANRKLQTKVQNKGMKQNTKRKQKTINCFYLIFCE